jgi:hypothetical protein
VRETRNLKLERELWAEELQTTILLQASDFKHSAL